MSADNEEIAVAKLIIDGETTIVPKGCLVSECVTVAKTDLKAGQTIDGIGGFSTYGSIAVKEESDQKGYIYELPHYHTVTSEYCYILEGETKYVDLNAEKEYHFRQGDFYILLKETRYVQKVKAGCRMINNTWKEQNDYMTNNL